ncbi:conserved hypothetical protein [Vibrio nigripulchritudo MADA3029]|uniref:CbrC family protein n=1 Tax=Vibrio nigripulchritudo TaxID=28173 RepID=UPI0003B1AC7F|nr:CbrC family protein [Vibrio nigripulchritudo]CCN38622.1 conserved hypothetical protein [Vibrio nigripulchritudo AM115]CCN44931.1 conserved hypothetical protein [Vibrio nigripulchritudo FTn2]CCN50793.1 conserved hypothetical protein [Vibrio nigripulchritudo MADA3020]CCN56651.1 conserved hypothetical protein [Vibrio nigripulchritudo MADA3021]CCN62508.1 conserved hypothetical protein [Vibrio nigripulchritudo MADA3029]CCN79686.1 conserved hypothetical protein [Vibrio nigripulchritudo SO65]
MPVTLPSFRYHPDPVGTGAVIASEAKCDCCDRQRGYVYRASFYSTFEVHHLCPWCIADGAAASKYQGAFVDDYPLMEAGLSLAIVNEVAERTPGYVSWQQEVWQCHCDDACEFHGDAEPHEVKAMRGDMLEQFLTTHQIDAVLWERLAQSYVKGGDMAIYKFRCRHCLTWVYSMDLG